MRYGDILVEGVIVLMVFAVLGLYASEYNTKQRQDRFEWVFSQSTPRGAR